MASSVDTQDAYVFVDSGSRKALDGLDALWKEGTIRYAVRLLSGAYGSLAFLEVPVGEDGLLELRERISLIRDRVNPGVSVGVAYAVGRMAPSRWSEKPPIGAYIRIRAEAGAAFGVFDAINALSDEDFYMGSALVMGDWDILLEIGAPTLRGLKEALGRIVPTPGILSTETALVLTERTEPRGPIS
jgi:hypothetical protein